MARTPSKPTSPMSGHAMPAPTPGEANRVAGNGAVGPTAEQIARRAYEIFEARGCQHGRDMEDWLQAERELRLNRK